MRLTERLDADRARFDGLASGFKMTGEAELARKAQFAAQALAAAARAVTIYQEAAAGASKPQETEA